MLKDRRTLQ